MNICEVSADHEHEVGERRGVGRAARARAEHHGDLRDDPGRRDVALEDAAVAGERGDALLDAGAGAVVEPDHRRARRLGQVHDLVDLRGVGLAQRAAEDPEVVGVDEDRAAVDRAPAGDDAVGVGAVALQAEPGRPVPGSSRPPRTTPRPAARRCARARSACPVHAVERRLLSCRLSQFLARPQHSGGVVQRRPLARDGPLGLGRCTRGLDVASSGEVSSRRRACGQPPVGDCSSSVHYVCSMSAVSGQFGPADRRRHE